MNRMGGVPSRRGSGAQVGGGEADEATAMERLGAVDTLEETSKQQLINIIHSIIHSMFHYINIKSLVCYTIFLERFCALGHNNTTPAVY